MKRITKPEQLPEWFNIEDYLQEPSSYYEAVRSIQARRFAFGLVKACDPDFLVELKKLVERRSFQTKSKYLPYRDEINDILMMDLAQEADPALGWEQEVEIYLRRGEIQKSADLKAKATLAKYGFEPRNQEIGEASLNTVLYWIEENEALIEDLKQDAKSISDTYKMDPEDARDLVFDNAALRGGIVSGSTLVDISDFPNPLIQIERLKKEFEQEFIPPKESELEKVLFKYRLAAYLDLSLWSEIEGKTITNACMAQALFSLPDDNAYGENHMNPSKVPGNYYHKSLNDPAWLDSLLDAGYRKDTSKKV